MKIINKYLYNIIFWISRFITVLGFNICLIGVLNAKYIFLEKYFYVLYYLILEQFISIYPKIKFLNMNIDIFCNVSSFFIIFCKNSQSIDLLIIALAIILILSIFIVNFINKRHKYLLTISIISSVVYLTMYIIFKLPIMLALTISTPIILLMIYLLNRICPIQKIIMLIPIIGEICCIQNILKHIFQKISNKIINIFLLIVALILSNIICFLFPYQKNKDFENLIMKNGTYSIRTYQDKMIFFANSDMARFRILPFKPCLYAVIFVISCITINFQVQSY